MRDIDDITRGITQQLKDLVRDTHVRQALQSAQTQADTINLLVRDGASRGLAFTVENVTKALASLTTSKRDELSEDELLAVSGGLRCNTSGGFPPMQNTYLAVCG